MWSNLVVLIAVCAIVGTRAFVAPRFHHKGTWQSTKCRAVPGKISMAQSSDSFANDFNRIGKALSAFSVAASMLAGPVFADTALKAELKDVIKIEVLKEVPTVGKYTAKTAYKVPSSPAVAPKTSSKASTPSPAPASINYEIKQDVELLKAVAAVKKTGGAVTIAAPTANKAAPTKSAPVAAAAKTSTPAAASVTKKASSSSAGKLVEEVAVEQAVQKKYADKARLDQLRSEANSAKKQADGYKGEVKKLDSKIDQIERKMQKKNIQSDQRGALSKEKAKLVKQKSAVQGSLRTAEQTIDRDTTESDKISKSAKVDDKVIEAKTAALKSKKEQLVKDAEKEAAKKAVLATKAREAAILKEFKDAESAEKKAASDLATATKSAKVVTTQVNQVLASLKAEQAKVKTVTDKIQSAESALAKAQVEATDAAKKSNELTQQASTIQREVDAANLVVKKMQAAADSAAAKTRAAKTAAKIK